MLKRYTPHLILGALAAVFLTCMLLGLKQMGANMKESARAKAEVEAVSEAQQNVQRELLECGPGPWTAAEKRAYSAQLLRAIEEFKLRQKAAGDTGFKAQLKKFGKAMKEADLSRHIPR